ncbi:hypothetical protein DBY65_000290 [Pseudomonas sp. RIT412]|nr:hypothetical protein DBP26_002230 [Pseudomonas sp. RIT 409]RAU55612.1 hypothetical protein DBY65_000290 [Pseudomonas sp. RIT 412]
MKAFSILAIKAIFVIITTIALGYCVMNFGPATWILENETGRSVFYWIFGLVDWQGTEGAEDLISLLSLSSMLIPSIFICEAMTRLFRSLRTAMRKCPCK